jgi:hypothetical protein
MTLKARADVTSDGIADQRKWWATLARWGAFAYPAFLPGFRLIDMA